MDDIRRGDVIVMAGDMRLTVRDVGPHPNQNYPTALWITATMGNKKPWNMGGLPGQMYRVLKPGALCGKRACPVHIRDLGGCQRYCREHWNAWEHA
jgi:hypothetical protein